MIYRYQTYFSTPSRQERYTKWIIYSLYIRNVVYVCAVLDICSFCIGFGAMIPCSIINFRSQERLQSFLAPHPLKDFAFWRLRSESGKFLTKTDIGPLSSEELPASAAGCVCYNMELRTPRVLAVMMEKSHRWKNRAKFRDFAPELDFTPKSGELLTKLTLALYHL